MEVWGEHCALEDNYLMNNVLDADDPTYDGYAWDGDAGYAPPDDGSSAHVHAAAEYA